MKAAILGAGISGLSAARLLKEKGVDVTVYEKETTVGGLARTRFTDGYLYDPYGGHIFNSKHPIVKEWVFNLLSQDKWKFTERNAKIFLNGRYIAINQEKDVVFIMKKWSSSYKGDSEYPGNAIPLYSGTELYIKKEYIETLEKQFGTLMMKTCVESYTQTY